MLNTLKKRLFCDKGDHKWEKYTMGNRLLEIDGQYGFWDIPGRTCVNCGRTEENRDGTYKVYPKGDTK